MCIRDRYKLWGNLLSINAWKSIPRQFEIEVENLFVDPPTKVQIPLDPTLSLPANSQMYFKKYNKLKKREEIGIQKLRDCLQMQEYFNNLLYFASTITDLSLIHILLAVAGAITKISVQEAKAI